MRGATHEGVFAMRVTVLMLCAICGCGSPVDDADVSGAGGAMPMPDPGGGGAGGEAPDCIPTSSCGPRDCGVKDNGCGVELPCDVVTPFGQPLSCASQNPGAASGISGGPMACNANTHVCECPAAKVTKEALAICASAPAVQDLCASAGGCVPSLCGMPPVPKAPANCIHGGATAAGVPIWCCTRG